MTNVLSAILEVFTSVATWLTSSVQSVIPMFYEAETGLTFLGVLAVAGLAISVSLLLLNLIKGFLRFQ
jgi:uncharacterized membrane protein